MSTHGKGAQWARRAIITLKSNCTLPFIRALHTPPKKSIATRRSQGGGEHRLTGGKEAPLLLGVPAGEIVRVLHNARPEPKLALGRRVVGLKKRGYIHMKGWEVMKGGCTCVGRTSGTTVCFGCAPFPNVLPSPTKVKRLAS